MIMFGILHPRPVCDGARLHAAWYALRTNGSRSGVTGTPNISLNSISMRSSVSGVYDRPSFIVFATGSIGSVRPGRS